MNDRLIALIRQQLAAIGRSPRAVSIEATGSPETLRKILDGSTRHPRADTLMKLAPPLGLTPQQLFDAAGGSLVAGDVRPAAVDLPARAEMASDVPVMGTAAGSAAGAFQFEGGVVDYVRRPPGLAAARDIYAIFVEGESMVPEHPPGALRFVSPHRPPALGDTVIVQIRPHDHAPMEAYIKHLVRRAADWVTVAQLNKPAEIRLKADSILAIHKVLTVNEMFGV
jgi:phage repressor protein C with HTH and peptisase S24 domain